MPFLSIITINKNNAAGLRRTLESVCSQDFNDFEYIVVDGASTDNSRDELDNYKDNINILISENDRGIYDAMNKGIAKASGEYLLFMKIGRAHV